MELSTGSTPDISGLLHFKFWEKVYYYDPPTGEEKLGRWCGRALNYGDTMCYWILTDDSNKLIVRGTVQSAEHTTRPNLTLSTVDEQKGEEEDPTLQNSAHNFPIESSGELGYINTEQILDLQYNDDGTDKIFADVKSEEPEEQPVYATRSYIEALDKSYNEELDGKDRWYFDAILGHKIGKNGKILLKMKWKGYDSLPGNP